MDPHAPPAAAGKPSPPPDEIAHDTVAFPAPAAAKNTAVPGRPPLRWLLDGLLIVVSVALGFSLTQWGERRHERELAERMLLSVRAEVEHNRVVLEPYLALHVAWRDVLDLLEPATGNGSARDVLFDARPPLLVDAPTHVPLLRRAAWDTALSTGTLRLVDYDIAAGISEIYNMQAYASGVFPAMFSGTALFDPAMRVAATGMVQTSMRELVFAEETLLALYDRHLPAIRAATDGR